MISLSPDEANWVWKLGPLPIAGDPSCASQTKLRSGVGGVTVTLTDALFPPASPRTILNVKSGSFGHIGSGFGSRLHLSVLVPSNAGTFVAESPTWMVVASGR